MTEYVFKPSRRVNGKRVFSRLYSGRYSLGPRESVITVSLHTPDERVAEKRLRDIIVEKQREREGLIAPSGIRRAQAVALIELIADYAQELKGRHLAEKHVHDTLARVQRVVREAGWGKLGEISADSFSKWRARFKGSAKTAKEYQISLNAFLNWLIEVERLERNPLAKLEHIETRGKQVRPYRTYTEAEIRSLLGAVSRERRMAYLMLLYTGQRMSEIAALVVEDLTFGERSEVRIRRETTKDKDQRSIALHPMLAQELRAYVPKEAAPTDLLFPNFPSYDALRADLKRANIERKDSMGRVLHFHSFRKTLATNGARNGVSQRMMQEILGHSDPALTANVYTDVAAVGMHAEIEKLPWVGNAQIHSLETPKTNDFARFKELLGELVGFAKAVGAETFETKNLSVSGEVKWLPGLGSNQADLEQRFYQIAQWRSLGYHWQLLNEGQRDFVNLLVFEVTKALVEAGHALPGASRAAPGDRDEERGAPGPKGQRRVPPHEAQRPGEPTLQEV